MTANTRNALVTDGNGNEAINVVNSDGTIPGGSALNTAIGSNTTAIGLNTTAVNSLTAAITPSGTLTTGTHTAPVSGGTATALGSQACKSVVIQVPAAGYSINWGSAAGTCTMRLTASATADVYSPVIPVTNISQIFVKSTDGTNTQAVNWFAIG